MSVRIHIDGALPRLLGLSRPRLKSAAIAFAAAAERLAKTPFREVTIVLQEDSASDAAHRAILNVAGATDVITQRYEPIAGEEPGVYGELYVNCCEALRKAPKSKAWSPAKELLLYVAHGFDHLAGSDDLTAAQYRRMRSRELRWLNRWLKENP